MDTMWIRLSEADDDEKNTALSRAAHVIRFGGLVAFPTETVYGLGGDAFDPAASRRIYSAKGRPSDNPLIVHISNMTWLDKIAADIPFEARTLAESLWPGPITMIFKKRPDVPCETTGGLDTVAVRMPDNEIALKFIDMSATAIAAPSANTSGRPSPTCARHVWEDLNGRIPLILDGGDVGIGIESTILDFTDDIPTILRPGYYTLEKLRTMLDDVRVDPGIAGKQDFAPKAPGMKYRHYAPKAKMTIVAGDDQKVADFISKRAFEAKEQGLMIGVLASDETAFMYPDFVHIEKVGSRKHPEDVAKNIYRALRQFDEDSLESIFSEAFITDGIGYAVMNRLGKAAGGNIIQV